MPQQVLSVGNCSADFGRLSVALEKHFGSHLHHADDAEAAEELVKQNKYDLILINRLFDVNQDSGIELIRKWKATQLASPMMLLSNYPEYQQEAMLAGAVPGFGKHQVGKPTMIAALSPYLQKSED